MKRKALMLALTLMLLLSSCFRFEVPVFGQEIPKEDVEFYGVFTEQLPSGSVILWYDFKENKWYKIVDRNKRLVETPDGYESIMPEDERWREDLPFALDGRWNNVEELTGADKEQVENKWGGGSKVCSIMYHIGNYFQKHPQDRILLLLMYKTYGGDVDLLQYVTNELKKERSFAEVITDPRVAGGIIINIFLKGFTKTLGKVGPKLTGALKKLTKSSAREGLEKIVKRLFSKEFLAKHEGELMKLVASMAKAQKRIDEIVDAFVKKLIELGNEHLTPEDIEILKKAVKDTLEGEFGDQIKEWLEQGEEQGWFEEGEGNYSLGNHTIVPTTEFESFIEEQVLVSLFDGFEGGGELFIPERGFGGIVVPVDKLGLLAPYIGAVSTILVATVATAVYIKRVKHRKEKQ